MVRGQYKKENKEGIRFPKKNKPQKFENYAWVLDYLPYGYHNKPDEPIVQGLGEYQFVLMEMIPKPNVDIELGERVYIGKGKRDKIDHVRRMIKYDNLTPTAKSELLYVIMEAVKMQEDRFVRFFNECPPITTRLHTLELLPEIRKKYMWKIIEEREAKKFESFKDFEERIGKDPVRIIAKRVEKELSDDKKDKYYLFVKWKKGIILDEDNMAFYLKE
jgi:putative nucleotide binding protein